MSEAITFKNSEGVISLKSPVVCNACNGVDYAPCCDNGENLADQIYTIEQEIAVLRAQEQNEPLTTSQLIKLDVAYFVFKENGLEHLSGWRVRKYCKQTDAHEFYGTDATYVDSRRYNDGSAGIIAYAREPKHAPGSGKE